MNKISIQHTDAISFAWRCCYANVPPMFSNNMNTPVYLLPKMLSMNIFCYWLKRINLSILFLFKKLRRSVVQVILKVPGASPVICAIFHEKFWDGQCSWQLRYSDKKSGITILMTLLLIIILSRKFQVKTSLVHGAWPKTCGPGKFSRSSLSVIAPRASHTEHRMQRCVDQLGIQNVGREPSSCRPNTRFRKPHGPFLIPG